MSVSRITKQQPVTSPFALGEVVINGAHTQGIVVGFWTGGSDMEGWPILRSHDKGRTWGGKWAADPAKCRKVSE